MGYRTRLGVVSKSTRERFMDKSHDECERELEDNCPTGNPGALYRPYFHKEYIELGKYCQFDVQPEPFYNGFDIYEECESEFHILTKDGLKQIIKEYQKMVYDHYQKMADQLENPDSVEPWDEVNIKSFLQRRANAWNPEITDRYQHNGVELTPYYLEQDPNKRDGFIARAWDFEYQVFNLSYIYSTFDWDNNYLIYSAW